MLDYHKLADEKHGFLTKPLRLGVVLGSSWPVLGSPWGRLGLSWTFWGGPGAVLEPSWAVLGRLGPSWGRLGVVFKPSAAYQRHAERRRSCGGAVE